MPVISQQLQFILVLQSISLVGMSLIIPYLSSTIISFLFMQSQAFFLVVLAQFGQPMNVASICTAFNLSSIVILRLTTKTERFVTGYPVDTPFCGEWKWSVYVNVLISNTFPLSRCYFCKLFVFFPSMIKLQGSIKYNIAEVSLYRCINVVAKLVHSFSCGCRSGHSYMDFCKG